MVQPARHEVDVRDYYITAADLAAIWNIPIAEVYRRAHRANWHRTTTRPVGYLLEDVANNDGARRIAQRKAVCDIGG